MIVIIKNLKKEFFFNLICFITRDYIAFCFYVSNLVEFVRLVSFFTLSRFFYASGYHGRLRYIRQPPRDKRVVGIKFFNSQGGGASINQKKA
jgi:hypothetical protein